MNIEITEEGLGNHQAVREVNRAAFDGEAEAAVVDRLRQTSPIFVSLVAWLNRRVVGHILFTPVRIVQDDGPVVSGMGLAPLAVLPDLQNLGIGTQLCEAGLKWVTVDGCPFVVVLGHPKYYPRFGFVPASEFGIKPSFPNVSDETFMIRVLDWKVMEGVSGVVYYRPEFDEIS